MMPPNPLAGPAMDLLGYQPVLEMPSHADKMMRRWMRRNFPRPEEYDHEGVAKTAKFWMKVCSREWSNLVEKEALRVFGRSFQVSDYRISGIAREEFSEEVKDKLRALCRYETYYRRVAVMHYVMAGHFSATAYNWVKS